MDIEKMLPGMTDYAVLAPNVTQTVLHTEVLRAMKLGAFSVCVRPSNVAAAVFMLRDSGTVVSTVAGFPHGSPTAETKAFEAAQAVANGAVEVDYVMNISDGLNEDYTSLVHEAELIRQAIGEHIILKVILETAYFTRKQIVEIGTRLAQSGYVDFLKTSTGFASEGATVKSVSALLQAVEGTDVEVKASGGINSLEMAAEYAEMGVTRFGTSKLGRFSDSNVAY